MGDLLAARPHLAGLLKLASTDHGMREVARELVRSWSTMSAGAWAVAVGGTGAPLQFAHARYKSALPEFLTKLSRALRVAARRDAARNDLRLAAVAALVSIAPPDSEDTRHQRRRGTGAEAISGRFSAPLPPRKRSSRPSLSLYLDFPLTPTPVKDANGGLVAKTPGLAPRSPRRRKNLRPSPQKTSE